MAEQANWKSLLPPSKQTPIATQQFLSFSLKISEQLSQVYKMAKKFLVADCYQLYQMLWLFYHQSLFTAMAKVGNDFQELDGKIVIMSICDLVIVSKKSETRNTGCEGD